MLKHADRTGARHVVLTEGQETILKDMESGEQESVDRDTVIPRVLKARHLS